MVPKEIRPFIGRECRMTVRCHACGREHERRGVLFAGPRAGHVSLAGVSYDVHDIIEVSGDVNGLKAPPLLVRLLPYAGAAGLLVTWLHLVHH